MTEWIDLSQPITLDDLHSLDRCVAGATGRGTLDDLAEGCFGSTESRCAGFPIVHSADGSLGCGCDACEARAGQSSATGRSSSTPSVATRPVQFAELDDDAAYREYLRASGRDPSTMPSLGNGKRPESVPRSPEVLRHVIQRGQEAEARLREAGYDLDDLPERAYAEEWTPGNEALWRQWKAMTA